jgi:hypothetical protein
MRFKLFFLSAATAFASASLTISSASLAADGQTMTLTMSAGSLAPASGLTGCFTMHGGNNNSNGVGAATASGSTVTFLLNAPMDHTNTVTVDIATVGAGCSLTSSGNTPTGQLGVSVINSSEWWGAGSSALALYARYDGDPALNVDPQGTGYPNLFNCNSADCSITVNATGSAVQIWAFQYNDAYSLYQDGFNLGRQKQSASTVFSNISLATGLTGTHLYRIVPSSGNVQFQVVIIAMIRFVGGGPTGTVPTPVLPVIGACGDSIVGSGGAPDDSTTVDWWLDSIALNTSAQFYTSSGQQVSTFLRDNCGAGSVPFNGVSPALWVLEGGSNDAEAVVTIGNNTTAGTFQGDMVTMIRNVQTNAAPPAKLLVRGILPRNAVAITAYTAAQAAAVAYVNSTYGTNVCFYSTTNWISASPFGAYPLDTVDGIHPNSGVNLTSAGFGKIANNQAPIFAGILTGSSFTVTGPPGGPPGSVATFTLTLAAGATFNSLMPVTISDGGAGGTITPSVGSPGVGAVTVTPSSGSSFTFTYSLASGMATLSYSSLADCWTAPAANVFTIYPVGTGGSTIASKAVINSKSVIH